MDNIYATLAKFFAGEATPAEMLKIEQFKIEKPNEFDLLRRLWESPTPVATHAFDTAKAWKAFEARKRRNQRTSARRGWSILFSRKAQWAAAAVLLVLLGIGLNKLVSKRISHQSQVWKTVQVPIDASVQEIQLSDGSCVWLDVGSQLRFPLTFQGDTRKLTLHGQAFFEVAKNPSKPFTIRTPSTSITVLGTSFNVHSTSNQAEVTVRTGRVKVEANKTKKYVFVGPNESAISTHTEVNSSANTNENYLAWKNGVFVFKGQKIQEVITQINPYYKNQITLTDTKSDCVFTGKFKRAKIEDLLEVLKLSCSIKVTKKKGHYIISSNLIDKIKHQNTK